MLTQTEPGKDVKDEKRQRSLLMGTAVTDFHRKNITLAIECSMNYGGGAKQ